MEHSLPSSSFVSLSLPPTSGASPVVPALNLVAITQKELTRLKWEGHYWKAQHQRSCEREARLKEEIEQKEALIRDLRHRLFGKKSETGGTPQAIEQQPTQAPNRPRGQQRGSRGHGRIQRPDLPVIEERHELQGESCSCPNCGLPYLPFPGDEEADIFEIDVKAYRRRVYRQRYQKSCSCPPMANSPTIIVAPPPAKVIPRSPYGTSIWVHILLGKFLYAQPLHRILRELHGYGLSLAPGTITGGLYKIAALFEPLKQAWYEHQMSESQFHNDESRWEVFAAVDGKVGHRWYLWVTRSPEVIYYQVAPTRSTAVPMAHFSGLEATKVIVVCDRYSAYKKLARLNAAIILAFCWAHVRRDFLAIALSFPTLKEWALEWVAAIGTLYHLNQQRLAHWQETLPLAQQGMPFHQAQNRLEHQVEQMRERHAQLLQTDQAATSSSRTTVKPPSTTKGGKTVPAPERRLGELHMAQRQVLASLQNHWQGLTVFVTHPEVPMDNNPAERAIRNPVIGRKNYYGSGSIWSAELAAVMFSLFQTIELWQLNPRHWLQEYLNACAHEGGTAPADITPFLPWRMSEDRQQQLAKPPPIRRNTS
jgi:transposase